MGVSYKLSPAGGAKAESKRERLLNAATRCIAREGMAKSSMEAIAAEAGVARITVYREFGSRKALIEALIAHRANIFNANFAAAAGPFPDIAAALEAFLLSAAKSVRTAAVTAEFLRGPMVFTKPGSALHEATSALWRPWLERARNEGHIRKNTSFADAVEWILIVQHTLCRLAIETEEPEEHLKAMIRSFIAPAFQCQRRR